MIAPLVIARCVGFTLKAPGFSHPSVPRPAKLAFAILLAAAIAPTLPVTPAAQMLAFIPGMIIEFALGAALGIASSVLYDGAYAGGRALDDYLGVRAGVAEAPLAADSGFGRLCSNTALAGLLLGDGYLRLLAVFDRGFRCFPPGKLPIVAGFIGYAAAVPTYIVTAAILIAGPAILAVFIAQMSLGALSRVVPRFASFTLAFPVTFALAILVILPQIAVVFRFSDVPWLFVPACLTANV